MTAASLNTQKLSSKRFDTIHQWVTNCFNQSEIILKPLAGDASFRHYYRLTLHDENFIVMDAPPEQEPLDDFLKTTNYLLSLGLNVPQIHHQNKEIGALILSDFGDIDLAKSLGNQDIKLLYRKAIDALMTLQSGKKIKELPAFNKAHMQIELSLFDDWFLKTHKNTPLTSHQACYDFLIDEILKQPTVAIHRDYHSRNLMVCQNQHIGVIDHQDMMLGPLSYDLVSLLRDCYVDFDDEFIAEMVSYYQKHSPIKCDNFAYYFDLTGIQRHLKAIGIFARLLHRDKNSNYIKHIPHALKMAGAVADKYPKLQPLSDVIKAVS